MKIRKIITFGFALLLLASSCNRNNGCSDESRQDGYISQGYFSILNLSSGKSLDGRGFTADGSALLQWDYSEQSENQIWNLIEEQNGIFRIINYATGLGLALQEGSDRVIQLQDTNTSEGLWKIKPHDEGFMFLHYASGKFMDNEGRINVGSRIVLFEETGDDAQIFKLIRLEIEDPLDVQVEGFFLDLKKLAKEARTTRLENFRYENGSIKLTTKKVNVHDPILGFNLPVTPDIEYAVKQYRWFTIEMSITKGTCAWLIAQPKGMSQSRAATILLKPDGKMHRYAVNLDALYREVQGMYSSKAVLSQWGLILSDKGGADVVIHSMAFGSGPMGDPMIEISLPDEQIEEVTAGQDSRIFVDFRNIGQEKSDPASSKIQGEEVEIPSLRPGEVFRREQSVRFETPGRHELKVHIEGNDPVILDAVAYADAQKNLTVPEPVPVQTDYLVGSFYYGGWFDESKWRPILPFPDKRPLLGWYREDDPVAMDWQIKWAVESGISFFTFCWYRMKGTDEDPVGVAPGFNDAVEKALPNARYKDMIRYSIMWCNNNNHLVKVGARDKEEFMEVLVPYWMETYFKDSNYLVIDNKPVFYIWQVREFISDMGGIPEAKLALEEMNEYAREHGFDGIYLIGNYVHHTPAHEIAKAIGIDVAYYYIAQISSYASGTVLSKQQKNLIARDRQAVQAGIKWLPAASMGWDCLGWYLANRDRWIATPDEFADVLKMNREYLDTIGNNVGDEKVLMLSVWNEYGEGHYIIPSGKYGFGYLDAIRDVFSKSVAPPHAYLVPEDMGMRLDQIFSAAQEDKSRVIHYWSLEEIFQ